MLKITPSIHNCILKISEESVDYYQMMGCEGAIVTQEHISRLDLLEEISSYPPRLMLQFIRTDSNSVECHRNQQVNVRFENVDPPTTIGILLESEGKSFIKRLIVYALFIYR